MEKIAFKLALVLSLLIHAGGISAYYLVRHEAAAARIEVGEEPMTVIKVLSEPGPDQANAALAMEAAKPLPVAVSPVTSVPETAPVSDAEPPLPSKAVVAENPPPVESPVLRPATVEVLSPAAGVALEEARVACQPDYLQSPKPVYPPEARRHRQAGLVVLVASVSREGLPQRIEVEQSSGHPLLDAAAVKAVNQWQFIPAREGGKVVESQVEIPVRFRLLD